MAGKVMKNALQEQLIRSGLVAQSKAEKKLRESQEPRKKTRPQPRQADSKTKKPPLAKTQIAPKPATAATADKGQEKLLKRRVKEFLRANQQNKAEAEIGYYFKQGNLAKRIYVTPEQRLALIDHVLVIVPFGEKHYLIQHTHKDTLRDMYPAIQFIEHPAPDTVQGEDDFPVPDDLMW